MVSGHNKDVSLLQGDKTFVNKVLSRNSSVGGSFRFGRYYTGIHGEVPFLWEEEPGRPKDRTQNEASTPPEDKVELPPSRPYSYPLCKSELQRPSTYYATDVGQVPFQWEKNPGNPKDLPDVPPLGQDNCFSEQSFPQELDSAWPHQQPQSPSRYPRRRDIEEEIRQKRPDHRPAMLSLSMPRMSASPGGSARWIKSLFPKKYNKMNKKVRRVRSEPRGPCGGDGGGRFRVSGSDRYVCYDLSNSNEESTRTSTGSSNSKSSLSYSSCSVGPLVHSSKFQILAKGLAKWVKL